MAGAQLRQNSMTPWARRSLTIPPDSVRAWIRLAVWEFWMGAIVCVALGGGVQLIVTSPAQIVTLHDLSGCYVESPQVPCERITNTGAMNVVFAALSGFTLLIVALWLLWELWAAVEPKPITDDFLRLLDDSFGRDWRNPFTWPWARLSLAYGFTLVGMASTAGAAALIGLLVSAPAPANVPTVETSQSFRLGQ
jgi:hypothetical protein